MEAHYGLCPRRYPFVTINMEELHVCFEKEQADIYYTPQKYTIIMPDNKTEVSLERLIEFYIKGHPNYADQP
jgi:hypothetical protein